MNKLAEYLEKASRGDTEACFQAANLLEDQQELSRAMEFFTVGKNQALS